MKSYSLIILFFILISNNKIISQTEKSNLKNAQKNYVIEQTIENLAEIFENDNIDYNDLIEELNYYYDNPININDDEQLQSLLDLRLLTETDIQNLIQYKKSYGSFLHVYELRAVWGFNINKIKNILPFITIESPYQKDKFNFKNAFTNGKSDLLFRTDRIIESREGFQPIEDSILEQNPNKRYLGSPEHILLRYRYNYRNNMSIGFTAEKDAGEEFFKGSQKSGFDFYSGHIFFKDIGIFKNIAIGDYQLNVGQGLTIGTGIAYGKSSNIKTIKRISRGLRRYTSANENEFLRGAATTIGLGNFNITGFFSHKKIDANLSLDDEDDEIVITSFLQGGYHRTKNELEEKDAIDETYYGGRIEYVNNHAKLGVTSYGSKYSMNFSPNLNQAHQKYRFSGNNNFVAGFDYLYHFKNAQFFGEIARSKNGGIALNSGMLAHLDSKLDFIVQYRNYGIKYQNLISNALEEGSNNQNEEALLVGIQAKLYRFISINAYADLISYPWLRNGVNKANSKAVDYNTQINLDFSKQISIYVRYRDRQRPDNITSNEAIPITPVLTQRLQNFRIHLAYLPSKNVTLKSRVEWSFWREDNQKENGFLMYQDVIYKFPKTSFSIYFRYSIFDISSFDARIYAYENDLLYTFSIPAYANRGTRSYLMLRFRPSHNLTFWLRYSRWYYNDRETISSGLSLIDGNVQSDIKFQIRYKF